MASGVNAQAKKAKRDTLYTITMSKIRLVDGKPTTEFDIVNLKWADTLWHVSRDLDFTSTMAIKNYRWFFYDKNHNVTRFERYVNEKLDRRIVYQVENGLRQSCNHYMLSKGDTILVRKDIFTRDAAGRVVKVKVTDGSGKTIASEVYGYDAKGNEVKKKAKMKVMLDADSVLNRQSTYAYDSLGRIIKKAVKIKDADGTNTEQQFAYTYNKEGKLERTTRYDKAGKMLDKEEIIYYSGRISQRKFYNADGTLTENLAFRYRKFGASIDNNMY